jgi:hypothetical protein
MKSSPTSETVSRRTALTGLGATGVGLALAATTLHTAAQDASTEMANHPLVGTWLGQDDNEPLNVGLDTYNADGTHISQSVFGGTGLGVWRATGERTADATVVFTDIDPDPTKFAPGTVTGSGSVVVDATGDAFTSTYTVQAKKPDGTVVFTAGSTNHGTRLQVEPMAPLGTPAAGTPTS